MQQHFSIADIFLDHIPALDIVYTMAAFEKQQRSAGEAILGGVLACLIVLQGFAFTASFAFAKDA
ncbi:MAG TPA: hypothetical protein VEH77_02615, partial [Roseiarcus sp.]|nr:hypothetical protein [Roseiarcus sp.]